MPWHTVTVDDVMTEFTPQEQAALQAIQGAADQLPIILQRVVSVVRGRIRAGGYALGAEGTTPDELDGDVVALARWRWLSAFPQLQRLQTTSRQQAHDAALAHLDRITRQQLAVPPPGETPRPPAPLFSNPKSGQWNSENKLIERTHPVPEPSTQFQQTTGRPYANPNAPPDD